MSLQRLLTAGCGAATLVLCLGVLAAPSAVAATPPSLTIHEQFTPLRCPRKPTTTVQLEGCAEHKVIATDKTIDSLNAKVFKKLNTAGRGEFLLANADWVRYRDTVCVSESSIYSGGSVHPVAYANCLVSLDSSHVLELKQMLVAVSPAG